MKTRAASSISFLCLLAFPLFFGPHSASAQHNKTGTFVTLEGHAVKQGNPEEGKWGLVRTVTTPVLELCRTSHNTPRGTVLLFPGGGYVELVMENEGRLTAAALNKAGYDVAVLEYHIGGADARELALKDALKAWQLLRAPASPLKPRGKEKCIMGFSAGGHLAARVMQELAPADQPDNLLLIYPAYLDEKQHGSVYPAVLPPPVIHTRLFTLIAANDDPHWVKSCAEYGKVWKGHDGEGSFQVLPDGGHGFGIGPNLPDAVKNWPALLESFLTATNKKVKKGGNPAATPVPGDNSQRHQQKLEKVAQEKFDLIMIGNSITHNFEKPAYQAVWEQFYASRKTLNLGFSGYRTENILWNLQQGELKGQSPKVVTLEIGTNNIDEKNYPTRHTAGELAGGIKAIVQLIRQKLPDTKIILLRCFPGSYDGPDPTSHRMVLDRASDMVAKLADGQHIFYCDVNHVFLNLDGTIKKDMMPDWLHPSPEGALAWAKAMEPLLSELMGDKSRDTALPANTAVIPVSKLENDSYDWWARHAEVLRIKDSINPEVVMIGNSITHFWGGYPLRRNTAGQLAKANGPEAWAALFNGHRVLNLGFGWDRTQNVLWRLDHGELDGLHPRSVVIGIGTNNTSETPNARANTPEEITAGIKAICERVRSKVPHAKIILMAILPREEMPQHPRRQLINETNRLLAAFAEKEHLTFIDIGPQMLTDKGILLKEIANDFCHPTEKGYRIWADALRDEIF